MAYSVVEFVTRWVAETGEERERHEVDIVPDIWIIKESKRVVKDTYGADVAEYDCWWPGADVHSTMASKMAQNKCEVKDEEEWIKHNITILYSNDDYLKAREKLGLAEDFSTIESTDVDDAVDGTGIGARSRRKKRPTKRYADAALSDEDNYTCTKKKKTTLAKAPRLDSSTTFVNRRIQPSKPAETVSKRQQSTIPSPSSSLGGPASQSSPDRSFSRAFSPIRETPSSPPLLFSPIPQNGRAAQPKPGTSREERQRPITEYNFQLKMFKALEEIKAIALSNRALIEQLSAANMANVDIANELPMADDPLEALPLPAATVEELELINSQLKASRNLRKKLIARLSRHGGNGTRKKVYALMSNVLRNRLAAKYSFFGRKQKLNLSDLTSLVAVVQKAIRKSCGENVTDQDIVDIVGDWLKHAKTRRDTDVPVPEQQVLDDGEQSENENAGGNDQEEQ